MTPLEQLEELKKEMLHDQGDDGRFSLHSLKFYVDKAFNLGRREQWNQDRLAIEHRKYGADEVMTVALLHAVSALEHTNPSPKACSFKCGRPLIDCQETCQRE